MMEALLDATVNRRGQNQQVLGEITQVPNAPQIENQATPKSSSPDELVIQQRGPRVIPATWSPVDCKFNILAPSTRHQTPDKKPIRDMKPGLRRRLTLSPVKTTPPVNDAVMKRIKMLSNK